RGATSRRHRRAVDRVVGERQACTRLRRGARRRRPRLPGLAAPRSRRARSRRHRRPAARGGAVLMSAPPKYATPRDPSRRTYGGEISRVAVALGKPPMPHQQLIYDVGTELDSFGNLVYELVIVTLPRQSGKTTL